MSILRVLILLPILLSGCISHRRTAELVNVGKGTVDNIPRAIIGAARAQPGANQKVLDAYERNIEGRIAAQDKTVSNIRKRIEDQEKAWSDFVLAVAQVAGSSVPGGGPIVSNFISALTRTREEAASYTDEVRIETENVLEAKIAMRTDQVANEMRQKLADIDTQHVLELERLKGNDKAFREMIQREARLTNAEMEALKGFSTEELMALLLAAGGAIVAGGALGKTGKSRTQSQIEAMQARLGHSGDKSG